MLSIKGITKHFDDIPVIADFHLTVPQNGFVALIGPSGCGKSTLFDLLFQQVLLRPEEFGVIATPNLNGDYISDALAAQVGGLGMAPGANIGDDCAVFEATHGTAPKYAGLDKVNPSSLILSGAMMLDYMGWKKAADIIRQSLQETVKAKTVTYDLARQIIGATEISCSAFGRAMVEKMGR